MFWTAPLQHTKYRWFSWKFFYFFNLYFYFIHKKLYGYSRLNWKHTFFEIYFKLDLEVYPLNTRVLYNVNKYLIKKYHLYFKKDLFRFFKPASCYFFEFNNDIYAISLYYNTKRLFTFDDLRKKYKYKKTKDSTTLWF